MSTYIQSSPEFINTFNTVDDGLLLKDKTGTLRDTEVFEVTRVPVNYLFRVQSVTYLPKGIVVIPEYLIFVQCSTS